MSVLEEDLKVPVERSKRDGASILLSQNVKSVSVFFFQWSCGLLGFL